MLGGHTGKGGQVQRVEQQPCIGHHVLDVGRLGIAQAAVFAKAYAGLVERHFKVVRMKARAKKYRDFMRHVVAQQFFNAAYHKARLAGIAQGGYQPDRFASFLAGEQFFAE